MRTDLFATVETNSSPSDLSNGVNTDAKWRQLYEKHLKSTQWKNVRLDLFRLRGRKCEACGKSSSRLEVHHLTYERLGKELLSDLKIVCKMCHEKEDHKRARASAAKRQANEYDSAFSTWFYKRTGMDPFYADESAWDEFNRWLQRKQEYYQY
jgi:hypothetical protein